MTTPDPKDGPTQAQIEAAKALHRYEVEHGYITREWGPTSDDENVYMAMAQAALTAAAEAGEKKEWPKEFWDEFLRLRSQEDINATIERCAQWLKEKERNAHVHWLVDEMCRALKDLP